MPPIGKAGSPLGCAVEQPFTAAARSASHAVGRSCAANRDNAHRSGLRAVVRRLSRAGGEISSRLFERGSGASMLLERV